jgi:hypothetical protein
MKFKIRVLLLHYFLYDTLFSLYEAALSFKRCIALN